MPIYEFECTACGQIFDHLQKLSDPNPACPGCTRSEVRRRLTAPAFRLAGSGWYETDFKSDKEKKRNLAGTEAPASGGDGKNEGGKSETKSEPKPATETKATDPAPAKTAASA